MNGVWQTACPICGQAFTSLFPHDVFGQRDKHIAAEHPGAKS